MDKHRGVDRSTAGRTHRKIDGLTDRPTDRQAVGQTDVQTEGLPFSTKEEEKKHLNVFPLVFTWTDR